MINILEICSNFGIWWTERNLQNIIKFINKDFFDVYSCALFNGWWREDFIKERSRDCLIAHWNFNKIKSFIINNHIEIVHWHFIPGKENSKYKEIIDFLKRLKQHSIKIIETSPFSGYNKEIEKYVDLKLFVSKTSRLKFMYENKQPKITRYWYVYNGIDIDWLKELKITIEECNNYRETIWIAKEDFVIWKISRADIIKRDDTIIDIIPSLITDIPNLKIVVRSIPEQKLKQIKRLWLEEYIISLPETNEEVEIMKTIQIMDIMLHTSRIGESFWISLVEGMFFEKPIITNSTDRMNNKRIYYRDNSQAEILWEINKHMILNDKEEIKNKIISLKENKEKFWEISLKNKEQSLLFDMKKIIKKWELIFMDYENKFFNIEQLNYVNELNKYRWAETNIKINMIRKLKENWAFLLDMICEKNLTKN